MTDMYVYYFKGYPGSAGENTLSERPATLEAIKARGEPVMASQIVVDHTELDPEGFLNPYAGKHSALNDLAAEIGSLERRALSRDSAALELNDTTEGKDKYMLSLESRELRVQARKLKTQRDSVAADARRSAHEILEPVHFDGIPSAG